MADESGKESLQTAVIVAFTSILSGDQRQRRAAEDELRALEVTEDFGLVLTEITVATDTPLPFRQLASVVLKQYVEAHWSPLSDKFCEPVPCEETKVAIRRLLPSGLSDPQSKIRATVAYAISALACWDWPEQWPELFDLLMKELAGGSPAQVHGTMRVLAEFCQDVSDMQLPHIAPVILPQLVQVIMQSEMYSVRTRSRAVHIFSMLAGLCYAMSETFTDVAQVLLFPFLPDFIQQFVNILNSSAEANMDPGLRKEAIMALCNLLRWFPSIMHSQLMAVVAPVWSCLTSNAEVYMRVVVNSVESVPEVCDSDGEITSFESVLFAIFEFITALVDDPHQLQLFPPILPDLIHYLIALMQISSEQVRDWEEDVCQYVEDDENELSYSIRLAAFDLLHHLLAESALASAVMQAILSAVDRHLSSSPVGQHSQWWKVHEACLLALEAVISFTEGGQSPEQLDFQAFVQNVVFPDLSAGASPLLTGRCLWLTSKMASHLKPEMLQQCLQATMAGLQPSQNPIVRLSAAKASHHFCSELQKGEQTSLLSPFLPFFLTELANMASDSHEDLLTFILDALQQVSRVDSEVTARHAERLVPLSIALFLKFSHDPGISSSVEEMFVSLAGNPGCQTLLHSRFLPMAVDLLGTSEAQLPLGIVAATMDILVIIVRGCPSPLPQSFISELFPAVVKRVLNSDESALLQNGGECVRAFVSVAMEQLVSWVDPAGSTGLQYVMQVIVYLLEPSRPEFSAAFVGKLIITFIKKVGSSLGNNLELLLRSVLSKMQQVDSQSVMQSLLVVFAHLVMQQLEALLSFLSQVPDPMGRSALEYVLVEWCQRHTCFCGVYEVRVSTVALCQLLSHCLRTGDQRLGSIMVEGEEPVISGDGIRTRSRSRAEPKATLTALPLPVKIFKLLIGDLQTQLETREAEVQEPDEEGDGWSSEVAVGDAASSLQMMLGSTMGIVGVDLDDEEDGEEDDPDLCDDPVLRVNVHGHLVEYLTELSHQPCFSSLTPMLNTYEKHTLSTIGVHC